MAFKAILKLLFSRISLDTINISYTLPRQTTHYSSNILCIFFSLYLGIICSFYLEFHPLLFLPSCLAPTGYTKISTYRNPTKEFLQFHEAFPSPQLEVALTFSELPKHFMRWISGPIFIVKDTNKRQQIMRGKANSKWIIHVLKRMLINFLQ